MASDEMILTHHRRRKDRVDEPRPVNHRFHFDSSQTANRFADAARKAGFPTGDSRSSGDKVFVSVDRLQPLAGPDGEPHEDFAIVNAIAADHSGARLDWTSPMLKRRPADSAFRLLRRAVSRRRINRL